MQNILKKMSDNNVILPHTQQDPSVYALFASSSLALVFGAFATVGFSINIVFLITGSIDYVKNKRLSKKDGGNFILNVTNFILALLGVIGFIFSLIVWIIVFISQLS